MVEHALKEQDDRDQPTPAEKLVMVVSVVVTLSVLGYMVWQAVALPGDMVPTASVGSVAQMPDGDVRVEILLRNEGSTGFREIEVEVDCGDSPPAIVFSHVPAHAQRTGFVVCPAGTEAPEAAVTWWVDA